MKDEYLKKIFINGDPERLPKECNNYLVQLRDGAGRLLHYPFDGDVGSENDKRYWLKEVDYYLLPVSSTLTDDIAELVMAYEELIAEIDEHKGTKIAEVYLRQKIAELRNNLNLNR